MKDAIKGYLALATGLTEVTRQRAQAAAKALVAQGEATAGQVQALADDLVAQSKSNREAVASLVRYEVDRTLGRVGFVSKEEVEALQQRIKTLEAQLRDARGTSGAAATTTATKKSPAKTTATKAAGEAAPAKKTASKTAAKRATATKADSGA